MDRQQVDRPAQDDTCCHQKSGQSGNYFEPLRPYLPKPPDAVACKEVTQDKPNVEILVVRQRLDAHRETESHDIQGAERQENAALEPGGKDKTGQNERPFQAKRKTEVTNYIMESSRLDDIAPVQ